MKKREDKYQRIIFLLIFKFFITRDKIHLLFPYEYKLIRNILENMT